jgi:cytochrome c-type biogenesis protein CcmH
MQRILLTILVYLMTSQIVAINCYSVEPDEFLQNPKKESRARNISKNVRCLVCQNQSIDESSAPLAKDLRILIRKKIEQGNSDEEIYSFLTERYGDFILLNPPFKIGTLLLWVLPFVFLAIGIFVIFLHNNKSKNLDYNK